MGSLREGGSVTVSLWVWCVNVWYPLWDNCRVGPLVVFMMTTPFLVCMGDHSFFPNNHEQVQNVKDPLLLMSLGHQDGQPNLHWLHWWTREATIPLPHRCGQGGIPGHFVFDFDCEGEGDGSL